MLIDLPDTAKVATEHDAQHGLFRHRRPCRHALMLKWKKPRSSAMTWVGPTFEQAPEKVVGLVVVDGFLRRPHVPAGQAE